MTRIVYVPLDERPCNFRFPLELAGMTDLDMIAPDPSLLGRKKKAADTEGIARWLEEQTKDADYALVSIDMLVYGGIVPSRLHHLSPEACRERLELLRRLKKKRPSLRIFAFNLIMRAPAYSSSEEEPDYYAEYGRDICLHGRFLDKNEREGLNEAEQAEWSAVRSRIPEDVLADFLARRRTNGLVNEWTVELVKEGVIDYLIIPLDDNARYGYTSADQRRVAALVEKLDLVGRVAIYPGADEIGCTLFARIFCETKRFAPLFHLRYSSTNGPFCIPKYEDRTLNESVKCHITAAGAAIGDGFEKPDIHLMIHSPAVGQDGMAETMDLPEARHRSYFSEVNIREFVCAIRRLASRGELIALADVALCNGGDHSLMKLLSQEGLLRSLACYAAWNTSGNTLGTVISHAIIEAYHRTAADVPPSSRSRSRAFYYHRLIDDWGFQSIVRQDVCLHDLPGLGADYFRLSHVQDRVEALIGEKLERFARQYLPELGQVRIADVHLPWNRMFEVDFRLLLPEGMYLNT